MSARATTAEDDAIRELDRRWMEAVNARDDRAIGEIYAEDGLFLPQGGKLVRGREAIRATWEELMKAPNFSLEFEPTTTRVSEAGDVAYDVGTYRLSMDGPEGRVEDEGKYVVVWEKRGGDWKVVADIYNSDRPAAWEPPAAGR